MSTAEAPPTRAEWVDSLLRRAIVSGELAPGQKLLAERLAEQWGVSPTPLRETFQRLAGEGLVVIEPQRGARVAPVDAAMAAEIYEMRLLLDPVALERSVLAARGTDDVDPQYVQAVDDAHRALVRRHRSLADYHDAHRQFHLTLVSRCPNQRMLTQVAQLLEHSQRFQVIGLNRPQVRRGDPAAEHEHLRLAARAGDGAGAAAVLRSHLAATLDAVRAAD
ncbi:MAG: GntR family transcriptional regulator [Actinobacteria bacterium]|nr:GntR family transcriptional regulator [Actinomycetota bacterium]